MTTSEKETKNDGLGPSNGSSNGPSNGKSKSPGKADTHEDGKEKGNKVAPLSTSSPAKSAVKAVPMNKAVGRVDKAAQIIESINLKLQKLGTYMLCSGCSTLGK